jgi:hypothetical protein
VRESGRGAEEPALPDSRLIGFETTPRPRRRFARIVWAFVITGLLAVVLFLQPPDRNLAWITFLNVGHAPLFGAIALAVLQFLLATPLAERNRAFLYVTALALTILLGILSELLQMGADRSSDPRDVMRDALGAGSFLLIAATRDPNERLNTRSGRAMRASCLALALALLVLAFSPAAWVAQAYAQRAAAFPALCDFSGTWETHFVEAKNARLKYTSLPGALGETALAAYIRFEPVGFAGFKVLEPYPDWTGYQSLRVVARSDSEHSVDLVLRIHDHSHDDRHTDRFSRILTLRPGINEFSIPLGEIRNSPQGREMDLSAIRRLNLYTPKPLKDFSLYLLELGLD